MCAALYVSRARAIWGSIHAGMSEYLKKAVAITRMSSQRAVSRGGTCTMCSTLFSWYQGEGKNGGEQDLTWRRSYQNQIGPRLSVSAYA